MSATGHDVHMERERTVIVIAYALHLFGAIAGLPSLIGLVLNYARRGHYGALSDSHHSWMIRSFWWAVLWILIGWVLSLVFIGWAILGLAWLWYVYRHVRGLIAFLNGQALPA